MWRGQLGKRILFSFAVRLAKRREESDWSKHTCGSSASLLSFLQAMTRLTCFPEPPGPTAIVVLVFLHSSSRRRKNGRKPVAKGGEGGGGCASRVGQLTMQPASIQDTQWEGDNLTFSLNVEQSDCLVVIGLAFLCHASTHHPPQRG